MRIFFQIVALLGVVTTTLAEHAKIKVGMLLPLTGTYAAVGEDNRRGIDRALSELGPEAPLQIVYADSRAEPAQAVSEFKKLIAIDNVMAVFVFRGPPGMAVNPLSKQYGVPLLGGVGNKDFAAHNDYAFQLWPRSDKEGEFAIQNMVKNGAKRIAILTAEDDYTMAVSDSVRRGALAAMVEVVFDEHVPHAETDFRALLSRLKSKGPDAVWLNAGIGQLGPLLRQIKDLQLQVRIYSNFWVSKPEVIAAAGRDTAKGVQYVEMKSTFPNFLEGASGATLSAYTATLMLGQAAQSINGEVNRENFYRALKEQKAVHSSIGAFNVAERCVEYPLVLSTTDASMK